MFNEIQVPVRFDEASAREEIHVHPMVLVEERELLEQLQTRAPRKRGGSVTMPLMFALY
jgi:hypothetical protein